MNRGDIVQKYRKNNSRNADFYVVLGKKCECGAYVGEETAQKDVK